jgi:2,3-bisphosphoglycerate-independent phosphoglycerate mutase
MAAESVSTSRPRIPVALVVLDGLGDRPHPATDHRSPVDFAPTPNLDRLTGEGRSGLVVVVGPGIAPESDGGVLALLGYDPVHDSPGRGVLEALGVDLPLARGDIALRLNFATADGDGTILDSRVGRSLSTREASELAEALTRADLLSGEGIRAEVRATVGHRGVLWMRPLTGGALSPEVSNADPNYVKVGGMGRAQSVEHPRIQPVQALDGSPEAERTARAIDLFLERAGAVLTAHRVNARRALRGQPIANALLVRNAGALPEHPLVPFEEKYGMPGASLTEMPVERGIARVLGLTDRYVGPMGPDRDAGYRERAAIARELLDRFPFVYVHLKGPDEPGHDGDAKLKAEIIEAIDRSFFGPFLEGLDLSAVRIGVTADHATPAIVKGHTDDPVPFLLCGAGVVADGSAPLFSEATAARGSLGTLQGSEVLPALLRPAELPRS